MQFVTPSVKSLHVFNLQIISHVHKFYNCADQLAAFRFSVAISPVSGVEMRLTLGASVVHFAEIGRFAGVRRQNLQKLFEKLFTKYIQIYLFMI